MSDPAQHEDEYTDELIAFLESLWGWGFLSPGGPEEVARIVDSIDLAGKRVLDVGCGSGGISLALARDHDAGAVVGIDVEGPVIAKATERAAEVGLAERVAFQRVEPGPLPFPDASFDVVFSKDAMIHIPDKETLFADVYRVLKPGGRLAASDWLISHDDDPSPEMKRYLEAEGLSFGMASPARYRRALEAAGFTDVRLVNRNGWYREVAREELAALEGPLYERAAAASSPATVDKNIGTWRAMLTVLESGEHCPHHLHAVKPAA